MVHFINPILEKEEAQKAEDKKYPKKLSLSLIRLKLTLSISLKNSILINYPYAVSELTYILKNRML